MIILSVVLQPKKENGVKVFFLAVGHIRPEEDLRTKTLWGQKIEK